MFPRFAVRAVSDAYSPASEDSNNTNPSAGTSEEAHVEEIKELPRKKGQLLLFT